MDERADRAPAGNLPPVVEHVLVEGSDAPHTNALGTSPMALERALVTGLAWTALARWGAQLLSWGSTLIVARVLSPEDFGIVGMTLVYIGLVQVVNDLGLGAAIVQNRAISEQHRARLYGLALLFGAFLVAVSIGMAWPVAAFFRNEAVRPVLMVLSFQLFFASVQTVPRSLLARDLEFRVLARFDAAQAMTAAGTTLVLALLGFRYWALVLGNLLAVMVASWLVVVRRPHPVAWPRDLRQLLAPLRFGGHVVASGVGWYLYGNADSAVAGRVLGSTALGAYSIAVALATAPITQVTGLLNRVTAGVFSAAQSDRRELRRYVTGLLEASAFLIFPTTLGLALVARDFVQIVIGDKWHDAIVPMQLLALAAALRCLSPIISQALVYSGHPHRVSRVTLTGAVVLPLFFIVGAKWGLGGIAAGWLAGIAGVILPLMLYYARMDLGLTMREFADAIRAPAICSGIMAVCVRAFDVLVLGQRSSAAGLALQVVVGVAAYAVTLRLLFWSKVGGLKTLISRVRASA